MITVSQMIYKITDMANICPDSKANSVLGTWKAGILFGDYTT